MSLIFISCFASTPQLTIKYLGEGQSTIRPNEDKRFLLLPIEEQAQEARLFVIADNDVVKTIQVRLAVNKIDYYVPLDLQGFAISSLFINIHNVSDEAICWKEMKLSDTFDTTNTEAFRPAYHFTPVYGWMNDPNGMIYKDGEYHLFYQYNPYGSMWGNMHWGHATSTDLVHWEHQPIALAPDGLGAIFSGSCVLDKDNTAGFGKDAIVAFYTSAGERQAQSMAYSLDNGRTFTKYKGNPILTSTVRDFRDPKVIWHEPTHRWVMVLAVGQEIQFFSSANLREWTLESCFGEKDGAHGGVWECPDLLELPVEGTELKKWVLIVNLNPGGPCGGSGTQYFVGTFDGKTFHNDSDPSKIKWMDYGKDHYATVTWSNVPDGRAIALAWMSNWQYANQTPTTQFRSANSVPRELSLYTQEGDIYLASKPVKELNTLYAKPITKKSFRVNRSYNLGTIFKQPSYTYELELTFRNQGADIIGFQLFNEKGEEVDFHYNLTEKTFTMDRTNSGQTGFSPDFAVPTPAPILVRDTYTLRLFVDHSSIEVFDGEGRFCLTNLVFPSEAYNRLSFYAKGGTFNVTCIRRPIEPKK